METGHIYDPLLVEIRSLIRTGKVSYPIKLRAKFGNGCHMLIIFEIKIPKFIDTLLYRCDDFVIF
jgi:hypothetical protein